MTNPTPTTAKQHAISAVPLFALLLIGCILTCASLAQTPSGVSEIELMWNQAAAAQQAQNYREAAAIYRQILASHPDLMEAQVNLGLMLHLSADTQEAIQAFDHVLIKHPHLFAPNLLAGLDSLKLDNPARAQFYLKRATQENPEQVEARVGLANSYLQLHQYPEALEQFTMATKLNAKNADAWYGLGATYLSMEKQVEGDLRRTASAYRAALLGQSFLQQGNTDKAISTLSAAIHSDVPCLRSYLGFAYLRASKLEEADQQFDLDWNAQTGEGCLLARLGRAELDAQRGDPASARSELQEAAAIDAAFVHANEDLLQNDQSKSEAAQAVLDHPDSNPEASRKSMSAAESVKRGRYSLCSDALASVTATSTLEDLRTALFCSYSIGRDDRVLQATQAILKGHPADPAALYWRVQSMERAGLAALTTATQLNPESASLHALMGDLLRAKGDLAEAAGEYRKAIAIQPGFLAAHLGLARDLYSDRKLPEAEGEVRGVLGASDQDPEANYLLGEILVNREALEDAFPYLQKALRASAEELPYVHADLGRVYEERGDAIHAIAELKQSVQRDADGSYNYRLGRLLMMTGDRAAAKAAFETSTRLRHETDAASLYEKE